MSGKKIDSLIISQNKDGTYTMNWDPKDPDWSWLNGLTDKEIQIIVEKAVQDFENGF